MQLPTPLLRKNSSAHKNNFGHVLTLAGSKRMLGSAALAGLSAMRCGAGLVTVGIPESLNSAAHKKLSSVIMTWPLKETPQQTIAVSAYTQIKKDIDKYQAIAIGPGLSQNNSTQKFILKVIENSPVSMVIDADALNALSGNLKSLTKTDTLKILTPHPGEMARLTGLSKKKIEANRKDIAQNFAKKHQCILLLKGAQTIVACPEGKVYVNKTGNVGMATAGSGDVLTGMIAAFFAQGMTSFEATKWGAYFHGKAGDRAAKAKGKASMIATDIIENITIK
ncbi:MAG: NAD(P)H-hydrate dehydratase [Candidatus Omnitrophica bacterium]|nr:NAD(P)H-hydrate dehydratase [Candidatus Omnitrophota bacterium]